MHADRSAARKAAEATARYLLSVADETTLGTFEEELVECIRALLAEQPEAGAKPLDLASLPVHFIAHLPRGRVFMHPDTPRSGVRDPWPPLAPSFTNWTGAATKPDAPAPSPARDGVREALAEIVEWSAREAPCACNVDSPVECWLCRWHGRATAALAARGERGE